MVKGPINNNTYICDNCIQITAAIISGEINHKSDSNLRQHWKNAVNMEVIKKKSKWDNLSFDLIPNQIHHELDRFVVGQGHAKKVLSVAIYNHTKRLNDKTKLIKKSNILIAGPSGCGKTLLARTLAKILDVPFVIADATSLTEAGYIGDDVEICIQQLIAADGNIELAQNGIVYINEIDKIARAGENRSITRDVSGQGVQESLLKLIESCTISVPVFSRRKHPQGDNVQFDTSNVLFICGGAFEGLFDTEKRAVARFNTTQTKVDDNEEDANKKLTSEALKKYGIMPELIGRLHVKCALTALTGNDLIRVLTEPEDAI